MSMDIYLGKNKKEAIASEREMSFPEEFHAACFLNKGVVRNYPQFCKLEDYYKDVLYQGQQIVEFQAELQIIAQRTTYEPLKSFLITFANLCSKAHSQGENVYCFCD